MFGDGVPGVMRELITVVPTDALRLDIPIITGRPRPRKWKGDKVIHSLRAQLQQIPLEPWEVTVGANRLHVQYDKTGAMETTLRGFLGQQATAFDAIVVDTLLANPEGYDRVALLSNSHPNSSSTGDNLTTDALSFSSWTAMKAQMRGFKDEDDNPLGINPDVLLVGPSLEQTALEITGAQRAVAITNAGVEGTANVVAAYMRDNPYGGQVAVVVSDEIDGTQWFSIDSRHPIGPIVATEGEAFHPEVQDSRTDEGAFRRNTFLYSLEGDYGFGAGMWQSIGGKIAA